MYKTLLIEHREQIVIDGKIATPRTCSVWKILAEKLNVNESTLYSYAVGERYDYRKLLLIESSNKSVDSNTSANISSDLVEVRQHGDFEFEFTKQEYRALIQEKVVKAGKNGTRVRTILKPHEWQETLQKYLWNIHRIKHSFHFDGHSVSRDANSGTIDGK